MLRETRKQLGFLFSLLSAVFRLYLADGRATFWDIRQESLSGSELPFLAGESESKSYSSSSESFAAVDSFYNRL